MTSTTYRESFWDRYILAQVDKQEIAIPSPWVFDILTTRRSHLLTLPFYSPMLLGIVAHRGSIVPLVAVRSLLAEIRPSTGSVPDRAASDTFTAIRLSQTVGELAGLGLVVDRILGSQPRQSISSSSPGSSEQQPSTKRYVFQPYDIPPHLWEPLR
jgi:chemotaxis signal transduction protein